MPGRVIRSRGRYMPGGARRYVEQRARQCWREMHAARRWARDRGNEDKGEARRIALGRAAWLRELLMIRRLMGG